MASDDELGDESNSPLPPLSFTVHEQPWDRTLDALGAEPLGMDDRVSFVQSLQRGSGLTPPTLGAAAAAPAAEDAHFNWDGAATVGGNAVAATAASTREWRTMDAAALAALAKLRAVEPPASLGATAAVNAARNELAATAQPDESPSDDGGAGGSDDAQATGGWEEYHNFDTGIPFFTNSTTRATTWKRPAAARDSMAARAEMRRRERLAAEELRAAGIAAEPAATDMRTDAERAAAAKRDKMAALAAVRRRERSSAADELRAEPAATDAERAAAARAKAKWPTLTPAQTKASLAEWRGEAKLAERAAESVAAKERRAAAAAAKVNAVATLAAGAARRARRARAKKDEAEAEAKRARRAAAMRKAAAREAASKVAAARLRRRAEAAAKAAAKADAARVAAIAAQTEQSAAAKEFAARRAASASLVSDWRKNRTTTTLAMVQMLKDTAAAKVRKVERKRAKKERNSVRRTALAPEAEIKREAASGPAAAALKALARRRAAEGTRRSASASPPPRKARSALAATAALAASVASSHATTIVERTAPHPHNAHVATMEPSSLDLIKTYDYPLVDVVGANGLRPWTSRPMWEQKHVRATAAIEGKVHAGMRALAGVMVSEVDPQIVRENALLIDEMAKATQIAAESAFGAAATGAKTAAIGAAKGGGGVKGRYRETRENMARDAYREMFVNLDAREKDQTKSARGRRDWEWEDGETGSEIWRKYSATECALLEAAFQMGDEDPTLLNEHGEYTVDLATMLQHKRGSGRQRRVRRMGAPRRGKRTGGQVDGLGIVPNRSGFPELQMIENMDQPFDALSGDGSVVTLVTVNTAHDSEFVSGVSTRRRFPAPDVNPRDLLTPRARGQLRRERKKADKAKRAELAARARERWWVGSNNVVGTMDASGTNGSSGGPNVSLMRTGAAMGASATFGHGGPATPLPNMMPQTDDWSSSAFDVTAGFDRTIVGDWTCAQCNTPNDAVRAICVICNDPKPGWVDVGESTAAMTADALTATVRSSQHVDDLTHKKNKLDLKIRTTEAALRESESKLNDMREKLFWRTTFGAQFVNAYVTNKSFIGKAYETQVHGVTRQDSAAIVDRAGKGESDWAEEARKQRKKLRRLRAARSKLALKVAAASQQPTVQSAWEQSRYLKLRPALLREVALADDAGYLSKDQMQILTEQISTWSTDWAGLQQVVRLVLAQAKEDADAVARAKEFMFRRKLKRTKQQIPVWRGYVDACGTAATIARAAANSALAAAKEAVEAARIADVKARVQAYRRRKKQVELATVRARRCANRAAQSAGRHAAEAMHEAARAMRVHKREAARIATKIDADYMKAAMAQQAPENEAREHREIAAREARLEAFKAYHVRKKLIQHAIDCARAASNAAEESSRKARVAVERIRVFFWRDVRKMKERTAKHIAAAKEETEKVARKQLKREAKKEQRVNHKALTQWRKDRDRSQDEVEAAKLQKLIDRCDPKGQWMKLFNRNPETDARALRDGLALYLAKNGVTVEAIADGKATVVDSVVVRDAKRKRHIIRHKRAAAVESVMVRIGIPKVIRRTLVARAHSGIARTTKVFGGSKLVITGRDPAMDRELKARRKLIRKQVAQQRRARNLKRVREFVAACDKALPSRAAEKAKYPSGRLAFIRNLMSHGVSARCALKNGDSALFVAALRGRREIVRELLAEMYAYKDAQLKKAHKFYHLNGLETGSRGSVVAYARPHARPPTVLTVLRPVDRAVVAAACAARAAARAVQRAAQVLTGRLDSRSWKAALVVQKVWRKRQYAIARQSTWAIIMTVAAQYAPNPALDSALVRTLSATSLLAIERGRAVSAARAAADAAEACALDATEALDDALEDAEAFLALHFPEVSTLHPQDLINNSDIGPGKEVDEPEADAAWSCACGASRVEFCYCDLKAAFETGLEIAPEEEDLKVDSDSDSRATKLSAVEQRMAQARELGATRSFGDSGDGDDEAHGERNPFRSVAAKRPFCYCGAARRTFCHCSIATTFEVIPKTGIVIRTEPEIDDANIIGRLVRGDVVAATGVKQNWVRHRWEGKSVWSMRRRGVRILLRPLGSTTSANSSSAATMMTAAAGGAASDDATTTGFEEVADALWMSLDMEGDVGFEQVAATIACSFANQAAVAAAAAADEATAVLPHAQQVLRGRYARRIALARIDVAAKSVAHAAAAAAAAAADEAVFSRRVAETRAPLLRRCRAFARWKACVLAPDAVDLLQQARVEMNPDLPPSTLPASTAQRLVGRAVAELSARCDALFFATRRARGNAVRRRVRGVSTTSRRKGDSSKVKVLAKNTSSLVVVDPVAANADFLQPTKSSTLRVANVTTSPRAAAAAAPDPIGARTRLLNPTKASSLKATPTSKRRSKSKSKRATRSPARRTPGGGGAKKGKSPFGKRPALSSSSPKGRRRAKDPHAAAAASSAALRIAIAAANTADGAAFSAAAAAGSAAVSLWQMQLRVTASTGRAARAASAAAKHAATLSREASAVARRAAVERAAEEMRIVVGGDELDQSLWDLV